jgi:DNA invertase Pin-like site-specific DNA recombinase
MAASLVLCDTGSAHGRLMLQILGSVAEFEHALIKARTSEGRKRDKKADGLGASRS